MLILSSEQVNYCNVNRQGAGKVESLPGVAYQHKLFVKGESYGKDQKQAAFNRGRQAFLAQKGLVLCLVVEDSTGFTIWYQDKDVKLADQSEEKADFISTVELENLVSAMRNVGGIKIQNRRYKLKSYPRCFVGSEVVAWLMNHFQISQADAVRLAQRLIDEKWIHHVVDEHQFKDGYFLYRFYWDE